MGPEGETLKDTGAGGAQIPQPPGRPGIWRLSFLAGGGRRRGDLSTPAKRRHLRRKSDQDLGERARFGATWTSPSRSS